MPKGRKPKRKRRPSGPLSLEQKVRETGGPTGLALEVDPALKVTQESRSAGLFGQRVHGSTINPTARRFRCPTPKSNDDAATVATGHSVARTCASFKSRFSRASRATAPPSDAAVHVVCSISENLGRETCVASVDAGSPISIYVTKQGNGQTYSETLAFLEILRPDEVILNEGRRNSPLARKVLELYHTDPDSTLPGAELVAQPKNQHEGKDRYGELATTTVVKFVSRSLFDQTKGAVLLRKIARQETYDARVVEEYILLSSANALLHYVQHSLGTTFAENSLDIHINAGGSTRTIIDRSSMLQLELLVNAKTGKTKDTLIGTIDCTKTTVGSRLLRTNLMSPPRRVQTINARLELVESFLSSEDFFYAVLDHLKALPNVDKMLSNVVLVPKMKQGLEHAGSNQRIASKGISSLVCIKTTLQALPSFANELKKYLKSDAYQAVDDQTVATARSSLLVGLGGVGAMDPNQNHLLRAILFVMEQPALSEVCQAVCDVFTETTTFSRNANAMKHQECFALKCDETEMMAVIRQAFLMNVDDIYKKADEYAEVHGFNVVVRYTHSRGYYLAVPGDIGADLPPVFIQPTRSGRFINCTTEEVLSLSDRARENVQDLLLMTHDRIQGVLDVARAKYDAIATLCDAIALLDMCHSFADNVTQSSETWCRPVVTDQRDGPRGYANEDASRSAISAFLDADSALIIRNGRYPIDTSSGTIGLVTGDGPPGIIPNDSYVANDTPFTVVTGINGSGKSTYLKQIGIITILAHCGSYVPADQATIPTRDRVCCRIGNADDQEHNISTFMLEMKEMAFICNNATDKSMVLVDELGRATSNEDGVAIAWSMAEYLLKKGTMTFFVTHYPQLSSMATIYPCIQNIHLEASVSRGASSEIRYTHKVKSGACDIATDYGVELAAFCGWPTDIVESARGLKERVDTLLPDNNICNLSALEELSDPTRTAAYKILSEFETDVLGTLVDDTPKSFDQIRTALIEMHGKYRKNQETVLSLMEKILSQPDTAEQKNRHMPLSSRLSEEGYDNDQQYSDSDESDGTSELSSSESSNQFDLDSGNEL